jgi:hypothetical protein
MKLVHCLVFLLSSLLFAQTATLDRALGTVINVDPGGRRITLRTDTGSEVTITAQPAASFRRVAPGETDLQKAVTIALTDLRVGDRVLARGKAGEHANSVAATLIVVMSQGDIAKKQEADRADWDRRGVVGLVTTTGTDQITISVRGAGSALVAITPATNSNVRRYAPDSVLFADARPSTLGEIKIGDQVRARGTRSSDGSKMTAEEVVSGTFRTIAGVILSLDAQQNEVRINDLESKRPLVIKVTAGSSLRRVPPQVAQAVAQRVRGNSGGPAGAGRGSDLQQLLESSPGITLADLKVGEALVISSTIGATAERLTAITVLAGVEPILRRPGSQEMSLGSWTLDIGNP